MKRFDLPLHDLFVTLAGDTFAICVLAAVVAATVLGFVFGAEAELIAVVVVLGVATAFAETVMRARPK